MLYIVGKLATRRKLNYTLNGSVIWKKSREKVSHAGHVLDPFESKLQ
jgi:hypothetical protein